MAWPVFSVFVVITGFILYSLLIAVVCDAVANANEDEDKISDAEAQELIQLYQARAHHLMLEQRQIQSLCHTCTMYSEKRLQKQGRPAIRRRSWFSLSFLFKSTNSRGSFMSDAGQNSKRSIFHLDDGSVSASSSASEYQYGGCWASPPGLRKFRHFCGALVNQPRVQVCIIALIAVNAFMMGLATFDFVTDSRDATRAFDVIDETLLIIFTVEIGLQVIYHGLWRVLTDGWMCFDFLVVVGSWLLGGVQIIRAFRVFRAFRLVARLDSLKKLVQALIDVAPSVAGILSLLALVMYIFAVMCTILFGDLFAADVVDQDYFGRLDTTFFSKSYFIAVER
jgi:hypothetical protein